MIDTLYKKLPVEFVSLCTPLTAEWESPYCQFIWYPDSNGTTVLLFVPAGVPIRMPIATGPVRCLLFQSAPLDSAGCLPSPLIVPDSLYLRCILQLLTDLGMQPAAEPLELRAAGLILCLMSEVPGGIVPEECNSPAQPMFMPEAGSRSIKSTCISGRALIYAVRYMYSHIHNPLLSLQEIAYSIGYHPNYFCHEFSKAFMQSPIRYLNDMRLKQTMRLLKQTDHSIKMICKLVGIAHPNKLCAMVKAATNMTP
ncbi:MAG: hypothetical protein K0Q90_3168, partial [Paenibacillaceae bacterium]|nr:hypothetical protein [Paenibacillaceae bacterium]